MIRTKFVLKRVRTKFKKVKVKSFQRNCPPKGKRWTDKNGKIHKGLLIRYLDKARKKGYQKLIFNTPDSNDKTIFTFKKPEIN
jgi:hypothetical protein